MVPVVAAVLKKCNEVVDSHYLSNNSESVTYPYLVFSYAGDALDWSKDGAYLDIDMFDNGGANQERIERMSAKLIEHLRHYTEMLDDCYIRFRYEGMNALDTQSDTLQRRNIRFYITIDWRNS